jgi:hypothetical protein
VAGGLTLTGLGVALGWWLHPGSDSVRLVEYNDGQIEIHDGAETGYFERVAHSGDELVLRFFVSDLYWEDGSESGYGEPPCMDDVGDGVRFGQVDAGVVEVSSPDDTSHLVWVRCR